MASTTVKTPCATCDKGTGLFKCEGCAQIFCTKHVVEHRETLHHQLDEVIVDHDILYQLMIDDKDQDHSLTDQINQWKQESIKKIEEIAQETREKLVQILILRKKVVSDKLNLLTERIKKARKEDDFFETDLTDWISTLKDLKSELTNVSLSNKVKEDRSLPLIYQLKLETNEKYAFKSQLIQSKSPVYQDIFERCLDGARIEDHGRLVIHNNVSSSVEIRGRVGYSSGTHQFRLQIEKNPLKTWIFLGVISKSQPIKKTSYESPSAYGWADYKDYFLAGVRQNDQISGQFTHSLENDIISLVFDCIQRTISYTNERNGYHQQLNVNIHDCPFPWQLHVNIFGENDQVRLLSVMSTF